MAPEVRVTTGGGGEPSEQLRAAIDRLAEAVEAEMGAEVTGFGSGLNVGEVGVGPRGWGAGAQGWNDGCWWHSREDGSCGWYQLGDDSCVRYKF